jgi:hypothetical protein
LVRAALILVAMMPGGSSVWQEFKKLEEGGKLEGRRKIWNRTLVCSS